MPLGLRRPRPPPQRPLWARHARERDARQTTNNGFGVAGAAYGVKIMPLKVLNDFGEGDS